jgi:small subunit ribosomal protein S25e
MGGTKKKPIARAEKAQQPGAVEPEKKEAKKGKGGPPAAAKKVSFTLPKLDDKQVVDTLGPLKAITLYGAAKALGVRASVANAFLRSLAAKGVLKRVAGYSGHHIYALAGAPSTRGAESG